MQSADALLMAVPKRTQLALVAATLLVMIWQCLPNVPREWIDYARVPALRSIAQEPSFGTDTIADVYESKVICVRSGSLVRACVGGPEPCPVTAAND
jgi:hypothetical protein